MVQVYQYCRFSSVKQERGDSLARQQAACRAFAKRMGWTIPPENEFGDFGVSAWKGDHLKKGQLGKFAARVRAGDVPPNSILIVEDLDRLSRQEPRITQRWLEDLTDLGLRFAVASTGKIYDADSLRASMFEVFEILMKAHAAWDYVQKLAHRQSESWVRRREEAANNVVVSAHCPGWLKAIGERKDPNRRFEIIPQRAAIVREIYEMAASGMGAPSIARTLNERGVKPWGREYHHRDSHRVGWEHTYILHILRSPAPEGDYTPGTGRKSYKNLTGERFVGYFPRVVDADLVARARKGLSERKGTGGRGRDQCANLFTGAVKCGACGGGMTIAGSGGKAGRYLKCINASRGRGCAQKAWFPYKTFEAAALDAILPLALDDRYFQRPDDSRHLAIELAELERTLTLKRDAAKALARQLATKDDPILREVFDEASADVASIQDQVVTLKSALESARGSVSPQEHLQRCLEVRGALEHPDHETRVTARRKVAEALRSINAKVVCRIGERKEFVLTVLERMAVFVFDETGALAGKADAWEFFSDHVEKLTHAELVELNAKVAPLANLENLPADQRERVTAYLRRRAA